jgi:hypothetical protein
MAAEGGSPPPASTVQFSAAAYSAGEGDGVATITLTRSAIGDETCVTVTVTPGSATAGDDFVAVGPFGVFWDPTDASPKTFDVTILGDPLPEGPETVNLQIFGGVLGMFDCGATLGTPSAATLTILDDDNVVTVVIPTVSEWGLLLLAAALGSLALARLHGGAARPRPGSP